ncbi:MAG TPA: hypothetical protein VG168_15715, partial [Bryobacteraceae bacterium]|nr:hypothetical protein [Bryobacteraceae bacterium]
LREWLQFELDSATSVGSVQAPKPAAYPAADTDSKAPVSSPAFDSKDPKPGGDSKPSVLKGGPVPFVIREQPAKPAAPSPAAPGSTAQPRVEPVKKEPTPVEPTTPQPTWEFEPESPKVDAKPEPKLEPVKPKVEPVAPSPSQGEPGEFTRFFKGGLPPAAPSRPDAFRSQDRPSHGHGPVQRPSNSPSNPGGKTETGEFTRIFMKSAGEQGPPVAPPPPPKPEFKALSSRTGFPDSGGFGSNNAFDTPRVERLPDLSNRPSDIPSMFQLNAEAPTPMRSAAQEPGEYTRMFGKGAIPPPPQAPSAVGPAPMFRTDDPLGGTTNFGMPAAPAPAAPPPPSGPSEFTRVMMGNRPPEAGAGQGAPAMAAPPAGGAPAGMGAPPAMGKPPAMPAQFPGMGGAPGAPAGGQAPMPGPGPAAHGGEGMGGAPMGGGMAGVRVTPMNPMYGMGGMGGGMGQASTNLGGMGSAGASMGNPLAGQAGHMGVMTPMGQMHVGGGNMQAMGQPGAPAGHPGAAGHAAGGHAAMPGQFPGALPKAPATGLGAKGKLLILFAVLGVLAVAMVLFVIFAGHK